MCWGRRGGREQRSESEKRVRVCVRIAAGISRSVLLPLLFLFDVSFCCSLLYLFATDRAFNTKNKSIRLCLSACLNIKVLTVC